MARRDHRVGLSTTTISVKLTAPELEALDRARAHERSVFGDYVTYHELRSDALRRLIGEAEERRLDVLKQTDERQVTLDEAIARKTEPAEAGSPPAGKTRQRSGRSRRSVRPAGKTARSGRKARIRR